MMDLRTLTTFALLAPLMASCAMANAQVPPESEKESNETRRLESEVEQYPAAPPPAGAQSDVVQPEAPALPSPTHIPEVIERSKPSFTAQPVPLGSLDARQVVQLQQRLRGAGHYLGKIDGVIGPQTLSALSAFARDQYAVSRRLLQDGRLTPELSPLIHAADKPAAPGDGAD